ncbi:MAG: glycosyltransferase [Planctomycetes bacterium]|nr:glycosyltransferase [Planctomycetota bacterium]
MGYLGTLADYKGAHLAVEAFQRLRPGEATLRIKGETAWFKDYTGPLLEQALGISGLTFEGAVLPGEGYRFLAEVDVLLVPSLWYENSPLTIHEAFQTGVPVVATDLGGMAELVEKGGGLLFRQNDAADLHRSLRRLLDEPGLVAALRRSIPAVKSIEENAAEMEALYLED